MTSETLSKTIMNQNKKILIIGNGYVGGHLINYLKDDFQVEIKSSKDLNYRDKKTLYAYLLNNGISYLVNCVGFTGRPNIDEAEIKKELCWDLNVDLPLQINKICNLAGCGYIHISSGCIYDGYEQEWSEKDASNFGLFSNNSSFYSKTKHAFEIISKDLMGAIIRVRMPFGNDNSHRNYLTKIRNYKNLINFKNSKTYIPDLCGFIKALIEKNEPNIVSSKEIYNVVNPSPLWTTEVCEIMNKYGFHNNDWQIVNLADLEIATGRSNCVLNCDKASKIFSFKTEREALDEHFKLKIEIAEKNRQDWIDNHE
jgi:dTDP-4-dehydrorhamnose reductase